MAKINKMLKFISENEIGMGNGVHKSIAKANASVGVSRKRTCDDVEGRIGSLINSLTPSAIG